MLISDILALCLSYMAAKFLFRHLILPTIEDVVHSSPYFQYLDHIHLYLFISLVLILSFFTVGHYTQRIPWWNQVRLLVISSFLCLLGETSAGFALNLHASGYMILMNWTLFFVICVCLRLVFFRLRSSLSHWNIPAVIIGDPSTTSDILYAFNTDTSIGYDVHTVILRDESSEDFSINDLPKKYRNLNVLKDFENHIEYIALNPSNYYVIVLDAFRGIERERMLEMLHTTGAKYCIVPSISRLSIYEMEPRYFFGYDVMLLQTRVSLSQSFAKISKRALDIVSSAMALALFSPMFLLVIAALKLEKQEGSIFYGGERLGHDGHLFKCWKFRTMAPNSDSILHDYLEKNPDAKMHWEKYLKLPNDPRVKTWTEKFLRKSSLDEIPQLWNVFIGDMSLVGPRPILPNEVDMYGETIKEYTQVQPGITGLWQVSGRNSMSFSRRVYLDSWYVRNWSFWADIVIILKTIPAVLLRDDGH